MSRSCRLATTIAALVEANLTANVSTFCELILQPPSERQIQELDTPITIKTDIQGQDMPAFS